MEHALYSLSLLLLLDFILAGVYIQYSERRKSWGWPFLFSLWRGIQWLYYPVDASGHPEKLTSNRCQRPLSRLTVPLFAQVVTPTLKAVNKTRHCTTMHFSSLADDLLFVELADWHTHRCGLDRKCLDGKSNGNLSSPIFVVVERDSLVY